MDKIKSINVELAVSVCSSGYEVIALKASKGGIASFSAEKPELIHVVVPKEPEIQEIRVLRDFSDLWKELVLIDNLQRVGGQAKLHAAIARYCGKFGLPSIGLLSEPKIPADKAYVADIGSQAHRMSYAIRNPVGEGIEVPADILEAFERDITFTLSQTFNDMYLIFRSTLLAAWFGLINSQISPDRLCEFCQGTNVSRAKARFCSSYCRDRWHKEKARRDSK